MRNASVNAVNSSILAENPISSKVPGGGKAMLVGSGGIPNIEESSVKLKIITT